MIEIRAQLLRQPANYDLILGNKNYSSWSLRAWLLFRPFGIPFEHQVVPLYTEAFEKVRQERFPARLVPALVVTDGPASITIWDCLSIAEFLSEQHPEAELWPRDPFKRAAARSLCAEMHSGFKTLRSSMPMNLKRSYAKFRPDAETRADIERVVELWSWANLKWGGEGPFMFGKNFTAADVFYAPVAARFRTYSIELDGQSELYAQALLSHQATTEFCVAAQSKTWVMEHNEFDEE